MRILIMGAPGAGKGTQARSISERYQIPAISTGSLFRDKAQDGTELGEKIKYLLTTGDLISDEITDQLLMGRLESDGDTGGFLLDGYPRTLSQAATLDQYLKDHGTKIRAVLSLNVTADEVVDRLQKRAQIEGRADDDPETVRHRIEVYRQTTKPVIDHYRQRGLVIDVDAVGSLEEVQARIFAALDAIAVTSDV